MPELLPSGTEVIDRFPQASREPTAGEVTRRILYSARNPLKYLHLCEVTRQQASVSAGFEACTPPGIPIPLLWGLVHGGKGSSIRGQLDRVSSAAGSP
jgi:hypothetical protein